MKRTKTLLSEMGTEIHGAAPKVPLPTSTGIRAPLTIDDWDDYEYSASTSGKKDSTFSSNSSDSGLETDGFVSGEEEFHTASERTFVADPNDEIVKDTHFVKEHVVSRPFVKISCQEIVEESIDVEDFRYSGSNEEVVEEKDNVEEYSDCRPFVPDRDGGTFVEEDENASDIELPVIDIGIAVMPKQGMPKAQLTGDSDDDSLGNESMDDESFSLVVRVPGSWVVQRMVNLPKVGVLDVEEVEDSVSQTDYMPEAEVVVDSNIDGGDNETMDSSSKENHIVIEKIVDDSASAEVIEENGLSIIEEVKDAELNNEVTQELEPKAQLTVDSDDDSLGNESVDDESFSLFVRVPGSGVVQRMVNLPKVGVLNVEEVGNSLSRTDCMPEAEVVADSNIDGGDNETMDSSSKENHTVIERIVDDSASAEVIEANGLSIIEEVKDAELNNEVVKQILLCDHNEADITGVQAVDNFGAASEDSGNCSNCSNKSVDANGIVVYSQSNDSGKLVNEVEKSIELPETPAAQKPESFANGHLAEVDELHRESGIPQELLQCSILDPEETFEIENDTALKEKEKDLLPRDNSLNLRGSERVDSADQLEQLLTSDPPFSGESSENHLQVFDAQVVTDSEEELEAHDNHEQQEISNSAFLHALRRSATGVGFAPFLSMRPTAQPRDITTMIPSSELTSNGESEEILSQEEKKKLDKLQQIRVKFLRLVHRLNQSPEDSIAAKVLYQLFLAAGSPSDKAFSFDFAKQAAIQLEEEGKNNLDFSLNILVIGKSGVGKSATINSVFGEDIATTNAFEPATTSVKEFKGTFDGVQIRVLDTPGLRSSLMDQSSNRKILLTIKKFLKKFPPDVVLYVDRVDTQTRDFNDLPLLKTITRYLGSSVWFKTIVALTHAASTPPDGPSGNALSYKSFVAQQSHIVQQLISHQMDPLHAIKPSLIPVSLIENQSASEVERTEQTLLPDGRSWRTKLLLLCYSMKILSEIGSVVKTKALVDHSTFFGINISSPPLPYFLSSLLQSNDHSKLSSIEGGENIDLAYSSDCDQENEDEYDQLPPFRPRSKSQIVKLNKEQRRAYFEEYDYRVKLLQKKQRREEVKRLLKMKKKYAEGATFNVHLEEDLDWETGSPAALAVPQPDMALPPSFDGGNPAYRYCFLDPSSSLLIRLALNSHGWDHDCGYDAVNIEDISGQFPAVISVQLTKDESDFNIHSNSSVSAMHGEKVLTMAGLDVETVGNQLAYTLKTQTKMKNFKANKLAAGISITFSDRNMIAGLKVEDQIAVGRNLVLVGSTGLSWCQSDIAYGANLRICLREKDYPIGQDQSTFGLSLMRWRGDLVLVLNLQSQFSVGRNSRIGVQAGLSSKKSGQISVRISNSGNLNIAMLPLGLLTIATTIIRHFFARSNKR